MELSGALNEAMSRAELGLPIPKGARFRLLKRVCTRLAWPLLRHQIAYNTAVAAELAEIREMLLHLETRLGVQIDLVQRQAFAWHHEGISELRSELVETAFQIGELHKKLDGEISQVRSDAESRAIEARRRQGAVDVLLNEVRRALPEAPSAEQLARAPGALDSIYTVFEDLFRGPSAIVREHAKEYLPDILSLQRRGPVLDLGAGRGEWLELLREAGVDAYGVDLNLPFVEECKGRGLNVVLADVCEHLASLPERSLTAITGFHLAEHLPVDRLLELMDLSMRALDSGGLLILETPNPENLVVGASSFYLDPTHQRPLPPSLLVFLLEVRGFGEVETRFLHPQSENRLRPPSNLDAWSADIAPLVEVINERLYGARDYAVIGRRL